MVIARSLYPIPSRTRPSKSSAPMVLSLKAWKSRSPPGLPRTEFPPHEISSSHTSNKKPRGFPRGFLFDYHQAIGLAETPMRSAMSSSKSSPVRSETSAVILATFRHRCSQMRERESLLTVNRSRSRGSFPPRFFRPAPQLVGNLGLATARRAMDARRPKIAW